jgi:outer membrane protein assembly factor BamD
MHRFPWKLAAALLIVAAAACRPEFNLKKFTTNEALYAASMNAFTHHHWDDAVTGFEKLTTDLPPRDSLLPRSYWYLAAAHEHIGEHLLAAQSFSRLYESFPEDTLADDAALESARSYARMWRKPQLDPTYGTTALEAYNTLVGLYPSSPLIPQAQKEIGDLENKFAIKDYDAGMYYFRHKFYDSGLIYFQDAVTKYASSPAAHDAALRMVESYKAVHYLDDASDLCGKLRQQFPGDREVTKVCTGVPVSAAAAADSTKAAIKADTSRADPAKRDTAKPPSR